MALESIGPQHTISVYQVSRILLGARKQQVDIERLLTACGVSPDILEQPLARVTQRQFNHLMVLLCRTLGDELLGLGSQPLAPGTVATGCRLLVRTDDLEEGLRSGFRYFHQVLTDFRPRLRIKNGVAFCELQDVTPLDLEIMYAKRLFLYFAYSIACWLAKKRIPLLKVFYAEDELIIPVEANQLFQAPVEVTSGSVGFCFDAKLLKTPVLQSAESAESFLRRFPANILVRYRGQSTLTERVRRLIRRDMSDAMPSLEQVAIELNMTPQTLRRRLVTEGKGFQIIKNELRRDLALELLNDRRIKVSDIASQLGFSELPVFYRAFRKWTGVTPSLYRQKRW